MNRIGNVHVTGNVRSYDRKRAYRYACLHLTVNGYPLTATALRADLPVWIRTGLGRVSLQTFAGPWLA